MGNNEKTEAITYKMNNLSEISIFLDKYRDFSKQIENHKIIYFKTKFDGLISGYQLIQRFVSKINEKEAINYNLFEVLNIKTAEVITHTPFLSNLLNSNGSHGQGDLFLKSFLEKFVPEEKKMHFNLLHLSDCFVEEEKPFSNGRIDLYIKSINPKNRFGIIIENKIYAGDQHFQISRYYDFIKNERFNSNQMLIFYLLIGA